MQPDQVPVQDEAPKLLIQIELEGVKYRIARGGSGHSGLIWELEALGTDVLGEPCWKRVSGWRGDIVSAGTEGGIVSGSHSVFVLLAMIAKLVG